MSEIMSCGKCAIAGEFQGLPSGNTMRLCRVDGKFHSKHHPCAVNPVCMLWLRTMCNKAIDERGDMFAEVSEKDHSIAGNTAHVRLEVYRPEFLAMMESIHGQQENPPKEVQEEATVPPSTEAI